MVNIWNAVPVHGHVQHVALGLVLRDGHRPRHGLPRLEPGPARLRAPGSRAGARAHPRHRGDAVPDGGAYHQYQPLTKRGNNAIGSGFNDDPLWLVLASPPTSRRPATGDPRRAGALRQRPGSERPLLEHLKRSFAVHARPPRPARPAADRPRRLERLPQPQLLLRDAGRVVPDHREPRGRHRRVGVHRRHVRARGAYELGGDHGMRTRLLDAAAAMIRCRARARLGRRVVPARLRLLRHAGRLGDTTRGRSSSSRRASA